MNAPDGFTVLEPEDAQAALACDRCGAMVALTVAHDRWHKAVGIDVSELNVETGVCLVEWGGRHAHRCAKPVHDGTPHECRLCHALACWDCKREVYLDGKAVRHYPTGEKRCP